MNADNPSRTMFGEPVRCLVLNHTPNGPVVYTSVGKNMAEQLRHIARLMAAWAETNCASNYSVWVKPTAKSSWEQA